MEGLKPILERRSCRIYTDKKVDDTIVETLLRAGMYAPSANNSQPWEFLVMRDSENKKRASALGRHWGMLDGAPLGILVLANLHTYKGSSADFFVQDCSAATENILLAAQAMRLGGVWLGLYPKQDRMKGLRNIYGIPEHIIPFSIVSIGYPERMPNPHTTYHTDMVHYDKY